MAHRLSEAGKNLPFHRKRLKSSRPGKRPNYMERVNGAMMRVGLVLFLALIAAAGLSMRPTSCGVCVAPSIPWTTGAEGDSRQRSDLSFLSD